MKKLFVLAGAVLSFGISYGQQYFSRTGMVGFYASTPLEDIKAENNQVYVVIDVEKKQLAFSSLLKGFIFPKSLMQEHFNENYVESDKYPKSTYKGKITNFSDVDLTKDGSYPVKMSGQLTIHGVTKEVPAKGTITVKDGKVSGTAKFKIELEDFNIEIPAVVKDKISKNVNLNVAAWLDPLQ